MQEKVVLKNISVTTDNLVINYEGNLFYSWLENADKHIPNVYQLCVDTEKNIVSIDYSVLKIALENNKSLKLSLSTRSKKLDLRIETIIPINLIFNDMDIHIHIDFIDNLNLVFSTGNEDVQSIKRESVLENEAFSQFLNSRDLNTSIFQLPDKKNQVINILVIGTCFSRSIFKSDGYFNPDYKKYFKVIYTAFHNSFLSLMSDPIPDINPREIDDLSANEVLGYVQMEFKKNLFQIIDAMRPDYIFVDNYIDANRPVVEFSDNQYITYNTYFSKSILKKDFSNKVIIFPGTNIQSDLYRCYIRKFYKGLKLRQLENRVILLGSRLCKRKIDTRNGKIEAWENPDRWINPSNDNWNKIDKIFLSEIPCSLYIDMRNTQWMSDVSSPIYGGATPSHYQSEYYKEIFNKLRENIFGRSLY